MNCNESIELLPWFLNGTLEEGEHDEVRRHLATCELCRAALKDTREAWTIFDQHLPSQTLVALAYGETPQGIDPALAERHLATCPQCAAELELARMSRRLEEDDKVAVFPGSRSMKTEAGGSRTWRAAALAASLTAVVAASGWIHESQRLAAQLAQKPVPAEAPRNSQPAALPPAPAGGSADEKVAQIQRDFEQSKAEMSKQLQDASLKLAELDRRAQELAEPQLNTWSDVLSASGVERGTGGATGAERKVIPGSTAATLRLGSEDAKAPRIVEIQDARGAVRWKKSGLQPNVEAEEYKLTIPPGFLAPGPYTIQLYTLDGRKAESYPILVK